MIIWKDFILDPVFGAFLLDEVFEGETHDLNLMEEGRVANQETRQLPNTAGLSNIGFVRSSSALLGSPRMKILGAAGRKGLDLKSATESRDAPAVVRLNLRNAGTPSDVAETLSSGKVSHIPSGMSEPAPSGAAESRGVE